MTKKEKIVKYFAIILALFIIIGIISLIIEIVKEVVEPSIDINDKFYLKYDNYLELDLSKIEVYIKIGDVFKAESDSKYIRIKQDGNKLIVKEKKGMQLTKNKTALIVTIPNNFKFDYVKIDNGAGNINIESLITNILDIDMGAGKLKVDSLKVNKKLDIDGGVGDINLNDVSVNELDLDLGAGNTFINGNIYGEAEIDTGVGNLSLNLKENIENYTFDLSKGIGNILINDEKIKEDIVFGKGKIDIQIDGGVGNIEINTLY